MRTDLQDILFRGTHDEGTRGDEDRKCECSWPSEHCAAYVALLWQEKLLPNQVLESTVAGILQKMENMPDPTMAPRWARCSYRWHSAGSKHRGPRSYGLERFRRDKCIGLCLGCVRSKADGKCTCREQ